jgi:hypothetical protein
VFWSGLAVTGPAIGAMMQLTEARWSPSVRRIAVTTVGFLPVAFLLLLVLFFGREALYPWVRQPIPVGQSRLAQHAVLLPPYARTGRDSVRGLLRLRGGHPS